MKRTMPAAVAASLIVLALAPAASAYTEKVPRPAAPRAVEAAPSPDVATPTPEPTERPEQDDAPDPGPTPTGGVVPAPTEDPDLDDWQPTPPRAYTAEEQACWDALVAQGIAVEDPEIDPCDGGGVVDWTDDDGSADVELTSPPIP